MRNLGIVFSVLPLRLYIGDAPKNAMYPGFRRSAQSSIHPKCAALRALVFRGRVALARRKPFLHRAGRPAVPRKTNSWFWIARWPCAADARPIATTAKVDFSQRVPTKPWFHLAFASAKPNVRKLLGLRLPPVRRIHVRSVAGDLRTAPTVERVLRAVTLRNNFRAQVPFVQVSDYKMPRPAFHPKLFLQIRPGGSGRRRRKEPMVACTIRGKSLGNHAPHFFRQLLSVAPTRLYSTLRRGCAGRLAFITHSVE